MKPWELSCNQKQDYTIAMNAKNKWHLQMYNAAFANGTIGSLKFKVLAEKQVKFLDSALGLKKGAKVLDVPCGTGRHSKVFARLGYQVTGLDISQACVLISKKNSKHKNAQYLHGNMADLSKFKNQYDLVINLFTSFGYFHSDKENEDVLKEMVRCLKPNGKLVINTISRDWILKIYQPARWVEDNSKLIIEASKYDPKTKYNESQMIMLDKKSSNPKLEHYHYHRVRLYSKDELVKMMIKAGLKDYSGPHCLDKKS
ncbi:MAG: class I SAM-dependent methyltransferase [Bdellovibrionales bacterium]|nr:class I SAM-dependent methyltransferase [Bdellovibrionales bacterium]